MIFTYYRIAPQMTEKDICDAVKKDDIPTLQQYNIKDINMIITENGETALHIACHHASIKMIKFLLNNGANVNQQNKSDYTPLHIACAYGRKTIISFLLFYGANKMYETRRNEYAYDIAILNGIVDFEILSALNPTYYNNILPHTKVVEIYPFTGLSSYDVAVIKFLSNGNLLVCSHKGNWIIFEIKDTDGQITLIEAQGQSFTRNHEDNIYSIDEAKCGEKTYFAVLFEENSEMKYYDVITCDYIDNIDDRNMDIVNKNKYTSSWKKQLLSRKQNPFCLPECISWDCSEKWIATGNGAQLTLWSIGK
jgi:ankyrin repeat protein